MASTYEEQEYECNETLLVKKIIFLLLALALGDGVNEYSEIKGLSKKFKEKKLQLPNVTMQAELLKLAMHLTQLLETPSECQSACVPYIIDKLYDIDKASKKPGFGTP